ncbi:MAG: AEC family transporter [Phycisphaerae bacterium]
MGELTNQLYIIATAVLGVFGIVGVGIFCRRTGWLTPAADETFFKLVIRLLFPAFILSKLLGNEQLLDPAALLKPPVIGLLSIWLGFVAAMLVGRLAGRWLKLDTKPKLAAFVVCIGMYNYGFVPIPITLGLFGEGATLGTLLLMGVGVDVAMWSTGVIILTGGLKPGWWKHLFTPPLLAIVLAVTLNLTGLYRPLMLYLPFVPRAMDMLGASAIPIALLLTGATIHDNWKRADLAGGLPTISAACLLRLGILPATFLAAALLLPLSLELKRVLVIEAAMPCAVFPIVFTRIFGGDVPTAVRVVLGTSIVSLITMPAWLMLGLWLLET